MNALKFLNKRLLRLISLQPEPRFTQQDYEEFVKNPVWIAFRQYIASNLDSVADTLCTSREDVLIYRAQGLIKGLSFILAGEDAMRDLIVSNATESGQSDLHRSRVTEANLNKMFKMMEDEENA